MSEVTELEAQLKKLESERDALFEKRAPIDKAIENNYRKIERLKDKLGKARIACMKDKIDWKYLLSPEAIDAGSAVYELRQKAALDLGLWADGYWSDTRQAAVKVKLTYGDPKSLTKAKVAVKKLIKFYTPHEDGFVWFGVFEHDLSADGIYTLHVKPDLTEARLHRLRYGRAEVVKGGTLDEVLRYIQENHWYDGKYRSYDD